MKHVIISGEVHGVGFRQYLRYQAKKLKIKGWVKNLPASRPVSPSLGGQGGPDEKVEVMLQGDVNDTEKMIMFCKKGPYLAKVEKIEIEDLPDQAFPGFDIIKN